MAITKTQRKQALNTVGSMLNKLLPTPQELFPQITTIGLKHETIEASPITTDPQIATQAPVGFNRNVQPIAPDKSLSRGSVEARDQFSFRHIADLTRVVDEDNPEKLDLLLKSYVGNVELAVSPGVNQRGERRKAYVSGTNFIRTLAGNFLDRIEEKISTSGLETSLSPLVTPSSALSPEETTRSFLEILPRTTKTIFSELENLRQKILSGETEEDISEITDEDKQDTTIKILQTSVAKISELEERTSNLKRSILNSNETTKETQAANLGVFLTGLAMLKLYHEMLIQATPNAQNITLTETNNILTRLISEAKTEEAKELYQEAKQFLQIAGANRQTTPFNVNNVYRAIYEHLSEKIGETALDSNASILPTIKNNIANSNALFFDYETGGSRFDETTKIINELLSGLEENTRRVRTKSAQRQLGDKILRTATLSTYSIATNIIDKAIANMLQNDETFKLKLRRLMQSFDVSVGKGGLSTGKLKRQKYPDFEPSSIPSITSQAEIYRKNIPITPRANEEERIQTIIANATSLRRNTNVTISTPVKDDTNTQNQQQRTIKPFSPIETYTSFSEALARNKTVNDTIIKIAQLRLARKQELKQIPIQISTSPNAGKIEIRKENNRPLFFSQVYTSREGQSENVVIRIVDDTNASIEGYPVHISINGITPENTELLIPHITIKREGNNYVAKATLVKAPSINMADLEEIITTIINRLNLSREEQNSLRITELVYTTEPESKLRIYLRIKNTEMFVDVKADLKENSLQAASGQEITLAVGNSLPELAIKLRDKLIEDVQEIKNKSKAIKGIVDPNSTLTSEIIALIKEIGELNDKVANRTSTEGDRANLAAKLTELRNKVKQLLTDVMGVSQNNIFVALSPTIAINREFDVFGFPLANARKAFAEFAKSNENTTRLADVFLKDYVRRYNIFNIHVGFYTFVDIIENAESAATRTQLQAIRDILANIGSPNFVFNIVSTDIVSTNQQERKVAYMAVISEAGFGEMFSAPDHIRNNHQVYTKQTTQTTQQEPEIQTIDVETEVIEPEVILEPTATNIEATESGTPETEETEIAQTEITTEEEREQPSSQTETITQTEEEGVVEEVTSQATEETTTPETQSTLQTPTPETTTITQTEAEVYSINLDDETPMTNEQQQQLFSDVLEEPTTEQQSTGTIITSSEYDDPFAVFGAGSEGTTPTVSETTTTETTGGAAADTTSTETPTSEQQGEPPASRAPESQPDALREETRDQTPEETSRAETDNTQEETPESNVYEEDIPEERRVVRVDVRRSILAGEGTTPSGTQRPTTSREQTTTNTEQTPASGAPRTQGQGNTPAQTTSPRNLPFILEWDSSAPLNPNTTIGQRILQAKTTVVFALPNGISKINTPNKNDLISSLKAIASRLHALVPGTVGAGKMVVHSGNAYAELEYIGKHILSSLLTNRNIDMTVFTHVNKSVFEDFNKRTTNQEDINEIIQRTLRLTTRLAGGNDLIPELTASAPIFERALRETDNYFIISSEQATGQGGEAFTRRDAEMIKLALEEPLRIAREPYEHEAEVLIQALEKLNNIVLFAPVFIPRNLNRNQGLGTDAILGLNPNDIKTKLKNGTMPKPHTYDSGTLKTALMLIAGVAYIKEQLIDDLSARANNGIISFDEIEHVTSPQSQPKIKLILFGSTTETNLGLLQLKSASNDAIGTLSGFSEALSTLLTNKIFEQMNGGNPQHALQTVASYVMNYLLLAEAAYQLSGTQQDPLETISNKSVTELLNALRQSVFTGQPVSMRFLTTIFPEHVEIFQPNRQNQQR
ncbi:MAG: hypothetical protein KatS3mg087_0464 [Patescibacteria group bacterium]|nr:MAG: hypothetical protein KatS3mg087_0464 [Patescibacteria group bacterium]